MSDPGPPLLISRELKVPSYSSKIEPLDEMTDCDQQMQSAQVPSQQKVIEEFEKLVTQDTLDLVKVDEDQVVNSVQDQDQAGSLSSETGFLTIPSKRVIKHNSVIEQQQQQQPGAQIGYDSPD